ADLPTCRPADLPTCRPADLPTCRPADLPSYSPGVSLSYLLMFSLCVLSKCFWHIFPARKALFSLVGYLQDRFSPSS
ncbi:MAG: hypothetical protein ACRDAP_00185, partial [Shewanella sp.]